MADEGSRMPSFPLLICALVLLLIVIAFSAGGHNRAPLFSETAPSLQIESSSVSEESATPLTSRDAQAD